MAKPTDGNINLIGPISQQNNGDFPLVYGQDIEVEGGKRLNARLAELAAGTTVEAATEDDIANLFKTTDTK